jgi:cytochrome bd-type quinol oxidase subunit 1
MRRKPGHPAKVVVPALALALVLLVSDQAWALEENVYRQVLGLDSRKVIWFFAQMHLFFAAFVLGVPLFAVVIELVGWKSNDSKFDKLAYEFTSLLSVAYATTAALGGLLAFALFTLYPTFMGYMAGIFKDVMFFYALLFFAETFFLYLYYFGPEMRGDTRAFMALLYVLPIGAGLVNILFLGVYHGYYTNTVYKVAASIPQVLTTLVIIVASTAIDWSMYRGARQVAPLRWGRVPDRAQYALVLLAVAFTWLMGLMAYIRSGIRQHWHVLYVMRDGSPDAYTPSLGYAANVVSLGAILFLAMVIFVFWLSQVSAKETLPAGYWADQAQ